MKYTLSRYNRFQPWQNGYHIAYNARSGAVALMTEENYRTYLAIGEKLSGRDTGELNASEQALLDQLAYGKFAFPTEYDELAAIKFTHQLNRFESSSLGLIVAPTMNCNMACTYCFEQNKRGSMPPEVIEALIEFVEKRAPGLRHVDINWYGGEPLLAMAAIEDITQSMLDLAAEHAFTYTSSMISNGYLLTPDIVDRLVDAKVSMVQITLDGPRRVHDERRPLKNGRGSFDRIIENITYAVKKMAIGVRVNIDKQYNEALIAELLAELEAAGLQQRVGIYFGLLEPASEVCANIAENCYNANEFSEVEVQYYRQLLQHGFRILRLPSPVGVYCMAQIVNAFLVDPDGDIYRCFNHVGDKSKIMGNIRNPINYEDPNFRRLFAFDPFEDSMCRECSILPICMGGCPAKRVDRNLIGEELCETWRHNLHSMLDIIAASRQQQQQAAAAAKE
ncbi:MAG: SPASM domain-containing protein [candidate division Zixibacteria bacterium]|nr:SPASM domain-containing protein [candidate division Zixibacteria bacterium]